MNPEMSVAMGFFFLDHQGDGANIQSVSGFLFYHLHLLSVAN